MQVNAQFFFEPVQARIHTKVSVREKYFVTSLSLEGLQVMYRFVLLIAASIQTVLIECDPMRCVSVTRCADVPSVPLQLRCALVGTGRVHYVSYNRKLFSCSDSVYVCVCVSVSAFVRALMERHQRARSQTVVYSCTNRAISDIVHE